MILKRLKCPVCFILFRELSSFLLVGAVVSMLNIDDTLATTAGNILGKLLLQGEGLEGSLDDVHGVARAPDLGADIQNTDARTNLVNVMVATVTETWGTGAELDVGGVELVVDIVVDGAIVIAFKGSQVPHGSVGRLADSTSNLIILALAISRNTLSVSDNDQRVHARDLSCSCHVGSTLDDQGALQELFQVILGQSVGERSLVNIVVGLVLEHVVQWWGRGPEFGGLEVQVAILIGLARVVVEEGVDLREVVKRSWLVKSWDASDCGL